MIMANGGYFYGWQFFDDDGFGVTLDEDEPVDCDSMINTIAEKSRGDYSKFHDGDSSLRLVANEEQFVHYESLRNPTGEKALGEYSKFDDDNDEDISFHLIANEDPPVNLESLFNMVGEKTRGDYSKNGQADLSSSTAVCPGSASYGAGEHSLTENGSLAFPFLHGSEASATRASYSNSPFVTERHTFDSGFEESTGSIGNSKHLLANNEVNQQFLSYSRHSTIGPIFDMTNSNDAFGFTNGSYGNPQLMDTTGINNGMFDCSTGNSYQTLEVPGNMGAPVMNLSGFSDILCDGNHMFSMAYRTCINEPFCFGSSNLNQNDSMLFNLKTDSEEHIAQNLSTNSAIAEGSKTCLPSGYHEFQMCNTWNKKQEVSVTNEKHDEHVTIPGTARKKRSSPKNVCKKAKVKIDDKRSGHNQVPSQDFPHQKPETPLPDGGLAVSLLRHQRSALSWMTKKETKSTHCCGGILADDQGLGKTVSAIALILKERPLSSSIIEEDKETETLCLDEDVMETNTFIQTKSNLSGGTLVVCPTSVLRQWNEELHNKVLSEANISVLVYYGGNRTKDPFELVKYDVVLTTYAIVSMEVPKQPLDEDDDETKIKISPTKKRKYPPTSDETPKKEPFESVDRMDRPLAKLRWFRVILDEAQTIKNYKTQVARACWGLKAKRRWCLSGTPIQNSVDDFYSYFRFLRYGPLAVFKNFCSQIKVPIQRNPVNGYKRLQFILKIIMLRRTKGTLFKGEPIISLPNKTVVLKKVEFTAEERGFYTSLEAKSRAQFAEYAAAGTVKQNYVNILFMLLRLRQACDHPLLVKECSSTPHWRSSVEKAKELPQEKLNRLLNCLEASLAICSICNDPPEDAVVTTCEHVFCNQCILEHLSSDDSQCPASECKKLLSKSSVFCKSTVSISINDDIPSSGSVESELNSLKIDAANALDSSKIKAALEVIQSISKSQVITVNDNNGEGNSVVREKAIVFSQWTRMLDLVEVCLKDSSIGYRRLDGTMSVVARDKAVKDFNTLPEVTVIIMSLKAASLGLNMVAACHVLLLDLWWNPTMEDQAIDRAHRIGQTRPVTVFRFTVKDTIEDRILALQKKKREMVASAFGDDENGDSQTRLSLADIRYLFQA